MYGNVSLQNVMQTEMERFFLAIFVIIYHSLPQDIILKLH